MKVKKIAKVLAVVMLAVVIGTAFSGCACSKKATGTEDCCAKADAAMAAAEEAKTIAANAAAKAEEAAASAARAEAAAADAAASAKKAEAVFMKNMGK